MIKEIKKGDLVFCDSYRLCELVPKNSNLLLNYLRGTSSTVTYCIVEGIIDRLSGEIYREYSVVTGQGERNSKVNILVRPLNINYKLLDIVLKQDPHHVYEHNLDNDLKYHMEQIENINKILNFRNYDRLRKLRRIMI